MTLRILAFDGQLTIRRWAERTALLLVLAGCSLRAYQWGLGRSLWHDEAMLAVNIQARGLAELLQPLEYSQSAPYLFLALTDLLTLGFGEGERVLRFLPLTASVVSLLLFWQIARTRLEWWLVPVAVGVFGLSYRLIYYAQEFKHYSFEVLVVVVVLFLTGRLFEDYGSASSKLGWLCLAGGLGIFASHTAPFCLAGAGLSVAVGEFSGRIRLGRIRVVLCGLVWLVLFGFNFVTFITPNYDNPLMKEYWAFAYPSMPWTTEGFRSWAVLVGAYAWYHGYTGYVLLALGLVNFTWFFCLGVTRLGFRWDPVILSSGVGIGCYLFAVFLKGAPFYGRLSLFLMPMLLMVAIFGLGGFGARNPRLALLGAMLLLVPVAGHLSRSVRAIVVQDQRQAISFLFDHRQEDEPVYVFFQAQPSLRYYGADRKPLVGRVAFGTEAYVLEPSLRPGLFPPTQVPDLGVCLEEIQEFEGHLRFWIVTANMEWSESRILRAVAQQLGFAVERSFNANGVGVFLMRKAPSS